MTAVVAVIIAGTKFTHGAWISILLMLALILLFTRIRRHYDWFDEAVRAEEVTPPSAIPTTVPAERPPTREHIVVPVDAINKVSLAAIAFVRELSGRATAVHVTDDREEAEELRARWEKTSPGRSSADHRVAIPGVRGADAGVRGIARAGRAGGEDHSRAARLRPPPLVGAASA